MHNLSTTLAAGSGVSGEHGRLAEILDEYLLALERGEPLAPDDLLARHPDLADQLRGYLSGLAIFHRAAAPVALANSDHGPALTGQLGDFRLIREIGRGGMGIVYEAVQVSLGRRVALKVLPASSAFDEKHLTRFKNEAQAAAQIDHPHIVPVFAVGQDRGIHYFAMQLIGGQSLSQLLDNLKGRADGSSALTNATRANRQPPAPISASATPGHVRSIARMGVQAAEALHAAHEIAVIHRDIKPSNLLLDKKGKVWITDFGVARCKSGANLTETGQALGTMAYMSPEQAEGRLALVDHRTDIYSLGVTLYELATLRHPSEGPADARAAFQDSRTNWRPPRFWNRAIPVDFENIVQKCISEAREDRYASARELADDLNRFLEGRPILARRPPLSARVVKWARRHRRVVATGIGAIALAFAGLFVSLVVIASARNERDQAYRAAAADHLRAETNYQRAQAKFQQAREMLDRFGARVAERLANEVPGAEGVRKELLAEMLPYYQDFVREAADDPALRADLALTLTKIGNLSEQLGALPEAQRAYEDARAILDKLAQTSPSRLQHLRSLALCCNSLGQLLQKRGDEIAAKEQLQRALQIQEQLLAAAPHSAEYRADLATTHNNLGLLASQTAEKDRATQRYRSAIQLQESLLKETPQDATIRTALAATLSNQSATYLADQPAAAKRSLEQALLIQLSLAKEFPHRREYQSDLALTYNNLGAIHSRLARRAEATQCYQDAIALQSRLVTAAPLVATYRRDLAVTYNNLGMAQSTAGSLTEAEASFTKALTIQQELVKSHPHDIRLLSGLGGIHNNLGMAYQKGDRLTEASAAFQQAIAVQKRALDRAPAVDSIRESLSKHYYNYAVALRANGRPSEAVSAILARRKLWLSDPDRLLRIAEELATAAKQLEPGALRQRHLDETAATLQLAKAAGLKDAPNLRQAPFDVLSSPPSLRRLTAVP